MGNKKSFELRENIEAKLKKKRVTTIFIFCLILLLISLAFVWLKYEVEGAKGLPFEIEEFLVISTADGNRIVNKNKKVKKDKLEISQVNDVFIKIREKDPKNTNTSIKKISITNFNIIKEPKVGKILILEPTGDISKLFSNSKKNFIDSSIEFKGAVIDNLEHLETSLKGGTIAFRIENKLGSYSVKKDEVFKYNSTLLNKFNKKIDDINFQISFDIIIELDNGFKYITNINLNKPNDQILKEDKTVIKEETNEILFKKV